MARSRLAAAVVLVAAVAAVSFVLAGVTATAALAQEKHQLAYMPTVPGTTTAWRLVHASKGDVIAKDGGQEVQKVALEIDMTLEYRLFEREPAPAAGGGGGMLAQKTAGVYDVQNDRIALKTVQSGATSDIEMSAKGMVMDGTSIPHDQTEELSGLLAAIFGAPVARLRVPPAGAPAEVEEIGSDAYKQVGKIDVPALVLLFQPAFPEAGGPVAIGEKWKASRLVPLGLEMEKPPVMEVEYELRSVAGGVATIGVAGKYEGANFKAKDENGRTNDVRRLRYDVKGELRFDVEKGRPTESQIDLVLDMDAHPEGTPATVSVTSTLPATYKLSRLE